MSGALVCLSGGIDSALVLDMMIERGGEVSALLFDYGQPHAIELQSAKRVAEFYGVRTHLIHLIKIPLINDVVFSGRNLVLASQAISIAASVDLEAVAFGCNQSDWDRFPDCRPAFWKSVNAAAEAYGVSVLLPLLRMTKTEVVTEAIRRGVPISYTWSCYNPQDGKPCGVCLTCKTRAEAGA